MMGSAPFGLFKVGTTKYLKEFGTIQEFVISAPPAVTCSYDLPVLAYM